MYRACIRHVKGGIAHAWRPGEDGIVHVRGLYKGIGSAKLRHCLRLSHAYTGVNYARFPKDSALPQGRAAAPPPPLPLPFPLPSLILPKCPLSQRERALSKIREGRGKGSGFVIATELCIMEFPRVFQTSRAHSRAPVFHSHICQKPCFHVLFRLFGGHAHSRVPGCHSRIFGGTPCMGRSPLLRESGAHSRVPGFHSHFPRAPGFHLYRACTRTTDTGLSVYRCPWRQGLSEYGACKGPHAHGIVHA